MRTLLLVLPILLAWPSAAAADPLAHTYSIVARDPKTGELVRFSIKATFNDPDAPATPAPAAKPPARPGGASGSR